MVKAGTGIRLNCGASILRSRRQLDAKMKDPDPTRDTESLFSSRDPALRQVFGEQWRGPENLDMAGMTRREAEEFLLLYGPCKARKALKKRRKADEQADKQAEKKNKRLFRR
jgi:hypothetical protein